MTALLVDYTTSANRAITAAVRGFDRGDPELDSRGMSFVEAVDRIAEHPDKPVR